MSKRSDKLARQAGIKTKIRIGPTIVAYLASADTFYADSLRRYVVSQCGRVAPESTGRCLRQLRKDGIINYEVVHKADSFYKVLPVEPKDDNQGELDL